MTREKFAFLNYDVSNSRGGVFQYNPQMSQDDIKNSRLNKGPFYDVMEVIAPDRRHGYDGITKKLQFVSVTVGNSEFQFRLSLLIDSDSGYAVHKFVIESSIEEIAGNIFIQ